MKDFKNLNLILSLLLNRNFSNFLDLNVKLNIDELTTSVYIKPTDRHQYLSQRSSHLDHIKRSIVYSQTLRASRLISSFNKDFVDHSEKMQIWFSKRGYPDNIVENKMGIKLILVKTEVKPNLPQKCLSFLRITPDARPQVKLFMKISIQSHLERPKNLVVTLLRPNYTHQKELQVLGNLVKSDIQNSDTFRSSVTSEVFKISHQLTCDDNAQLIYLHVKHAQGSILEKPQLKCHNYKSNNKRFQRGEHYARTFV